MSDSTNGKTDPKEQARQYAGLKKGFDYEEEKYYNSHAIEKYEAYLAGFAAGQSLAP